MVTPSAEKVCGATTFPKMLHYGASGGGSVSPLECGGVTVTGIGFEVLSPHTALKFSCSPCGSKFAASI